MIVTNEYVAYDTNEHYYYLTEAGMVYYTGYAVLSELWDADGNGRTARRLRNHGRQLHNKMINSVYNGKPKRYRHRDLIEYTVFLNLNNERDAVIQALTDIIEATYDTDWDRTLFTGEVKWPGVILQPLSDAGVYFRGEMHLDGGVPEDEYEVEY